MDENFTKFFSPTFDRKTIRTVKRKKLLAMLEGMKERLVHVSAPAGFGKTVLFRQWTGRLRNRFAWLDLDAADNDATRFSRRLFRAIAEAQRSNRRLAQAAARETASPLNHLLSAPDLLLRNGKRHLLVLDGLHAVTDEAIHRALFTLLRRPLHDFTVCLLSRTPPPDPMADFALRGEIRILTASDLAFDEEETAALFALHGVRAGEDERRALLERTGGWPIALLAELSGAPTHAGQNILHAYFKAHVWNEWDEPTRELLMKLAPADALCGGICERLAGCPDGEAALRHLTSLGVLVSPIRPGGQGAGPPAGFGAEHRGPPLLAPLRPFLLDRLVEAHGREAPNAVRRMLGDWHFERKEYYAAAPYYAQCGHIDGIAACCVRLWEVAGDDSVEVRIDFVRRCVLDILPLETVEANLPLTIQCAYTFYLEGDTEKWARFMDLLYAREREGNMDPAVRFLLLLLRSADFRVPLLDFADEMAKKLKENPQLLHFEKIPARSGNITQNLPFMHISTRDRSEFVLGGGPLSPEVLSRLSAGFGPLLGAEHKVMLACIEAGLSYEQNRMEEAFARTIEAQKCVAECDCRAEVRFSADMILLQLLIALRRNEEAERLREEISAWIGKVGFDFLRPSFRAFEYGQAIRGADREAAEQWLDRYAVPLTGRLPFYRIYQHFITMRALIATGRSSLAVVFGEKLLKLASDYRRPLNVVEGAILLSVAYWNALDRKSAVATLEQAVGEAERYGYTRRFVEEAGDIRPVMTALIQERKRLGRSVGFAGEVQLAIRLHGDENIVLAPPPNVSSELNERQKRLLNLAARGLSGLEMAEIMEVKRSTVRSHLRKLYRLLGVSGADQALQRADELGLLSEPENLQGKAEQL